MSFFNQDQLVDQRQRAVNDVAHLLEARYTCGWVGKYDDRG